MFFRWVSWLFGRTVRFFFFYLASGFWLSIFRALLRKCLRIILALILLGFFLLCAPPRICRVICIFDPISTVHERFFCALIGELPAVIEQLSEVDQRLDRLLEGGLLSTAAPRQTGLVIIDWAVVIPDQA